MSARQAKEGNDIRESTLHWIEYKLLCVLFLTVLPVNAKEVDENEVVAY